MQNEELINLFTNLIESTQYLKKGTVISFDNQKAIVRLSDQTTVNTKNLNVNKLGDCLVIKTDEGLHAFSESHNSQNQVIHKSINQRVNRTKDTNDIKQPEVYFTIAQIVEEPIKSTTPSKFVRYDLEVESLLNRNTSETLQGPYTRRYCVELVDALTYGNLPDNRVFNTLEECLLYDPANEEGVNIDDDDELRADPNLYSTLKVYRYYLKSPFHTDYFNSYFDSFINGHRSHINVDIDIESLQGLPFKCRKKRTDVANPLSSYYPETLPDGTENYYFHFPSPYFTTFGNNTRTFFGGTTVSGYFNTNNWKYHPDFPQELLNMQVFDNLLTDPNPFGFGAFGVPNGWIFYDTLERIDLFFNWYENSKDQFLYIDGRFIDIYAGVFDKVTPALCLLNPGDGNENPGNDEPPETTYPKKDTTHYVPLSERYKIKFYLGNSNQEKALLLHEMSVDDYFCYDYHRVLERLFGDKFISETSLSGDADLFFKRYARKEGVNDYWYISEYLLKYFNNKYLSYFDMYLSLIQTDDNFSFSKRAYYNAGLFPDYRIFQDLVFGSNETLEKRLQPCHLFSKQGFSRILGCLVDSISYTIPGYIDEEFQRYQIFYKSKKEILILINEGLVKVRQGVYSFYKSHLIYVNNFKIKKKHTETYPNINDTYIQNEISNYSKNKLFSDYYKYQSTLYCSKLIPDGLTVNNDTFSNSVILSQSTPSSKLFPNFDSLNTFQLFLPYYITSEEYQSMILGITPDSYIEYFLRQSAYLRRVHTLEIDSVLFELKLDLKNIPIYNKENVFIGTRKRSLIKPFSIINNSLGIYENFNDLLFNGKYLTLPKTVYTLHNGLIEKGPYIKYFWSNFTTNRSGVTPGSVTLDNILFLLVFTNKKKAPIEFFQTQPTYNTKTEIKHFQFFDDVNNDTSIKQLYNISQERPPIFLNERNAEKTVKVNISLPKNIDTSNQLKKKHLTFLSMQLIP